MKIVILGAGGSARETVDVLLNRIDYLTNCDIVGMVVDDAYYLSNTFINGIPLQNWDWLEKQKDEVFCVPAVGAPEIRKYLVEKAERLGCKFVSAIHRTVEISESAQVGKGEVICGHSILTSNCKVGDFCQINMHSIVAHDTILGDFVTLGIGVHLPGKVKVGEGSYIGSGVDVVQPRLIGEWSRVGAGAVLIEDVPSNSTVVGNPGRVVRQREKGWQLESIG